MEDSWLDRETVCSKELGVTVADDPAPKDLAPLDRLKFEDKVRAMVVASEEMFPLEVLLAIDIPESQVVDCCDLKGDISE